MQENRDDSELRLMVTGTRRDGRRRYERESKQALARACLQPGVLLAGMALKHGVNANLLRKWVVRYQRESGVGVPTLPTRDPADAFAPVILSSRTATRMDPTAALDTPGNTSPPRLRAQLPNGVTLEFDCTGRDADLVSAVIKTLGRCDVPSRR